MTEPILSTQFASDFRLDSGDRFARVKELTVDPAVRQEFERLILAPHRDESPSAIARLVRTEGASGMLALEAAVVYGGLASSIALTSLVEGVEAGERSAREVLSRAATKTAVYVGSFDPVTRGHLDLIARAARLFDHLIVGVGINPGKNPTFTEDERVEQIQREVRSLGGGLITVKKYSGATYDFALEQGAGAVVRGVRAITGLDQEFQLAEVNRKQSKAADLDTILLPARLEFTHVSSTHARELAKLGGELSAHVTPAIEAALIHRFIENSWRDCLKQFGIAPTPLSTEVLTDLIKRYDELGREYHTVRHLYECLVRATDAASYLKNPALVKLALFFHDAIYDPQRKDNERISAYLARTKLGLLNLPSELVEQVVAFVSSTEKHQAIEHPDNGYFLDCDLAILGATPDRYAEYANAVRLEYRFVPEEAFRFGRAEILGKFLERDTLFFTEYFRERFEQRARSNLRAERRVLLQ